MILCNDTVFGNDHNFKADSNDKVGGEVCEHRKANVICLFAAPWKGNLFVFRPLIIPLP